MLDEASEASRIKSSGRTVWLSGSAKHGVLGLFEQRLAAGSLAIFLFLT